jgi:hypothetical protein
MATAAGPAPGHGVGGQGPAPRALSPLVDAATGAASSAPVSQERRHEAMTYKLDSIEAIDKMLGDAGVDVSDYDVIGSFIFTAGCRACSLD